MSGGSKLTPEQQAAATLDLQATRPFPGEGPAVSGVELLRPTALLRRLGVAPPPTLEAEPTASDISLGRFQVLSELGRGGMGRVLEARDPELRRRVAVKVLIDPTAVDAGQLARFVAEAQVTSQLQHPGIVPVYEMGATADGRLFFVMKKVTGRSLRELLRAVWSGGPEAAEWPFPRLLGAFVQVCHAVAYAHDRGVLHRDLKPDNIMLGAFGEVLVLDWGVARVRGARERVRGERPPGGDEGLVLSRTLDGIAIGSPGYMPPEQARGELDRLDERGDVWSLGAVLYEVVCGRRAVPGRSVAELMYATVTRPPAPPARRDGRVPPELSAIVMRALAPEPADRFPDVAALGAAVQAFVDGSQRRASADRYLRAARDAARRREELGAELDRLRARERDLRARIPRWAALDAKRELFEVVERIERLEPERGAAAERGITSAEKALARDPEHAEARALLAELWTDRFEQAERRGARGEAALARARALAQDDGRLAARLTDLGRLDLATEPPGAEVLCARVEQVGLLWRTSPPRSLGRSPLRGVELPVGSYVLTLRLPGREDATCPVRIDRGGTWSGPPVPLLPPGTTGADWVYVPPGPVRLGGDPLAHEARPAFERVLPGFLLARFPVSLEEYCRFLDHLAARDPDEAFARSPRQVADGGHILPRPAPGAPWTATHDVDGDVISPRWPLLSVSRVDAELYLAWRSEREGVRLRLPHEDEIEKAARGVDGRAYPWGDRFDPALCLTSDSRPGTPQPLPIGTFPTDRSVYGARDLAGSMKTWCAGEDFDGDPVRRPVKGGCWNAGPQTARAAGRQGIEPWYVSTNLGLRLARDLP